MVRSIRLAGAMAALAAIAVAGSAAAQAPAYKLTRAVPLGGPDRWDYVVYDAPSHRVYVAHGSTLSVVDGRDGKVIGKVDGVSGGTHGTAIVDGKGYTDDGEAGVAVVFDPKTLKVEKRIPAAPDADGIVADPVTGHVFVVDGDSAKVTVIDPRTETAIATIDGGGKLETPAVDGKGHVFVNGAEKREVLAIDARTNKVYARWPAPDCVSPHGIAVDAAAHRVFVTCVNSLMVVFDSASGRVVARAPIGRGTDSAAFDPVRHRVFSANGRDGTISVIQQRGPDSYEALTPVQTAVSGRTMAVDPQAGRLYVAAAEVVANPTGGRPRPRPGSLKLLFLDPVR